MADFAATALAVFTEEDVFPGKNPGFADVQYEDRLTGKVLVFNEKGEVALVGTNAVRLPYYIERK